MRLFCSLRPSPAAVEDLDAFCEPRRATGRDEGLRWSPPELWHVTLAFCADLPDHALEPFVDAAAEVAARHRPGPLTLAGGGAFPSVARAKVVWAGVGPAEEHAELAHLAAALRAALSRAGGRPDGAGFAPHLTLARTGRPRDVVRWVRLLDAYAGPAWQPAEVEVVLSHLGEGPRGRPRHEVWARAPLGGR